METRNTFSNGDHNGEISKMMENGHCLRILKGTDFFRYLERKSSSKSYETLYHFIKTITQKLEDEQTVYILNLADILWKIQLWKEKLPGVKPFYAVKANSDPVLIRLLVLLGFSYDCSTKGEIKLVLENGGDPKDIIFAHTVKTPTSLKYASEVGVELMTFDNEEELFKIQKHYPNAKLVIRIKPETPPRKSNEIKHCPYNLGEKYGCPVQDAERLLRQAVKLNLNVVGVSFHVGAVCDDPTSYAMSIANCRLVFDFAQRLGFNFEIIDIGAGFHGSAQREKFFDVVTTQIKAAITRHFSEKNVKIIAEPGCYLVGSAQRHVTCVIGKRSIYNKENAKNDKGNETFEREYFLNDGYYNNFFEHIELYDVYPRLLVTNEELKKRPIYKSKLWGQTCCSEDIIQEECLLPDSDVGEYLVWENMGAYTQGVSSTFTIVPAVMPKHVFILNSRLQLNWIDNIEEIAEFLIENTVLIKSEKFP